MPQVITAVAAVLVSVGFSTAVATWVATLAVNFAVSFAIGALFGKRPQNGFTAEAQARTQIVRSSVQPRNIVYGTAMTSGPLVFAGSSDKGDSKNQYLHLVIALANHECHEVAEIYLGDDALGPLDGAGMAILGKYAGKVRAKIHLGATDQLADADLIAEMPANWSVNHRLRGVCYLYIRFEYDVDVFTSGLPNVKALVRGKKVFDPRTGETNWSSNWALCINDYLRSSDGLGCETDDVDEQSVIAAANISEEFVLSATGQQARYSCNGVVSSDRAPDDNLRQMATAGGGPVPVLAGGVFRVFAGAYDVPTITLTDSDLRGPIKVRPRRSRRDLFNAVKGTYIDGSGTWQPVDFPIVRNSIYADQDGGEIPKDIELPFTINSGMAQRLAKITLERARQGITVDFPAKRTAFRLTSWSTVKVYSEKFGWNGKVFRVLNWSFDVNGGVDLVLGEESPDAYSWNSSEETTVDPAPDTNLPPAGYVQPLGELTVETGDAYLLTLADGTTIPRLYVSWASSATGLWRQSGTIEIQYKPEDALIWSSAASVPGDSTGAYVSPVEAGVFYNVRARVRSSLGRVSDWSNSSEGAIGKTTPPPPLGLLSAHGILFGIQLQWNFPANSYAQRTEIWFANTSDLFNAVKLGDFAYPQNTHAFMGLQSGEEHWFWGRLVDTSGNIGAFFPTGVGVYGKASDNAADLLGYLSGQITTSQLAEDLRTPIEAIPSIQAQLNAIPNEAELKQILADQQNSAAQSDALAATQLIAMAGSDKATAAAKTLLSAKLADANASISDVRQAVVEGNAASAEAIQNLNAEVFDPTTGLPSVAAAVQQTSQALASTDDKLAAMYAVKTQVTAGGIRYFAGFSLGVELDAGVVTSQFLIYANRFGFVNDEGGVVSTPFVQEGNTTYLNKAVVKDASIDLAKINVASIGSLSALSATIGVLQTSETGARSQLSDDGLKVYGANGVLRFIAGKLS